MDLLFYSILIIPLLFIIFELLKDLFPEKLSRNRKKIFYVIILFTALLNFIYYIIEKDKVEQIEEERKENEKRDKYFGILVPKKEILFSISDGITPEIEIGMSGAVIPLRPDSVSGRTFFDAFQLNDFKVFVIDDTLRVSVNLVDSNKTLIVAILLNEWKVRPPSTGFLWDRNYSSNALEIINNEGQVIFQIQLINHRIRFQGILYNSIGIPVLFKELPGQGEWRGLITLGSGALKGDIKPIFKYPSELHLGEYVQPKYFLE